MLSPYTNLIIKAFEFHADPIAAVPMKLYLKNKFDLYGIKSPLRKEISKSFLSKNELPSEQDIAHIAHELWDRPQRELQYFTMELLQKYVKISSPNWIDLYEQLIVKKSWWDSVDGLAAWSVGAHFRRFPDQISPYTNRWMGSGNIWLQRTCLIYQLKYKELTNFELLKSFITPLTNSKEFFIRKAIGWALRQYSRTNPQAVEEFVAIQPMSNLSYREALRLIR
jgi:3-methyladenine DNA glycosylase AlkD